jgi:hypothetical protein
LSTTEDFIDKVSNFLMDLLLLAAVALLVLSLLLVLVVLVEADLVEADLLLLAEQDLHQEEEQEGLLIIFKDLEPLAELL